MKFNYKKFSRLQLTAILILTALLLIILGNLYYYKEKEYIENKQYNIIRSVAELKADQLSQWYNDRLAEATFFSSGPAITQTIQQITTGEFNNDSLIRNSLKQVMHDHRYENIFIISPQGDMLFSVLDGYAIDSTTVNTSLKAIETEQIVVNDFYYCRLHGKVHFDIVAPVYDHQHTLQPRTLLALMVFRVDPHDYLYRLIKLWPGESMSAETVLGRKIGDKVVYLNNPGGRLPNSAMRFGWPADNFEYPIVQAANGKVGRYIGKDYKGNEVLSDLRKIPGTPWSMVVKIDTSEVYKELYRRSSVLIISIVALILALVVTLTRISNVRIRESERNFSTLFEKAPMAYQSLDINGNLLEVNQAWCDMLGYSREEVVGCSVANFLPSARVPNFSKSFSEFKKLGRYSVEFDLMHKNGQPIRVHYEGKISYNSDGSFNRTHCIMQDITEKSRIFSQMKESERRLTSIISHLPGFVYRCKYDDLWTILYISEACQQITGYTSDEIMKSVSGYNDIILPEFRELVFHTISIALKSGDFFEIEYQIRHKSGTIKWMNERGKGVYDDKGHLLFLEGYVEDISVRHEARQALIEARDKAEESDRLKTAFLANMSHEIRTPMNGILGFIELLKETDVSDKARSEYLNLMYLSSQRLLGTINDIIEISRIESGRLETKITQVDLNDLFNFYTDFFKPEADLKNISLIKGEHITPNCSLIMSDRHKLDGILTNLVKNAIKFTRSGTIEIGSNLQGHNLLIWVKDTGRGIPENRQKAIFERFVQANMNFARDHEGSGLGLAIVKAYVDLLGGSIWVESTEGVGSTFFVQLPYTPVTEKAIALPKL